MPIRLRTKALSASSSSGFTAAVGMGSVRRCLVVPGCGYVRSARYDCLMATPWLQGGSLCCSRWGSQRGMLMDRRRIMPRWTNVAVAKLASNKVVPDHHDDTRQGPYVEGCAKRPLKGLLCHGSCSFPVLGSFRKGVGDEDGRWRGSWTIRAMLRRSASITLVKDSGRKNDYGLTADRFPSLRLLAGCTASVSGSGGRLCLRQPFGTLRACNKRAVSDGREGMTQHEEEGGVPTSRLSPVEGLLQALVSEANQDFMNCYLPSSATMVDQEACRFDRCLSAQLDEWVKSPPLEIVLAGCGDAGLIRLLASSAAQYQNLSILERMTLLDKVVSLFGLRGIGDVICQQQSRLSDDTHRMNAALLSTSSINSINGHEPANSNISTADSLCEKRDLLAVDSFNEEYSSSTRLAPPVNSDLWHQKVEGIAGGPNQQPAAPATLVRQDINPSVSVGEQKLSLAQNGSGPAAGQDSVVVPSINPGIERPVVTALIGASNGVQTEDALMTCESPLSGDEPLAKIASTDKVEEGCKSIGSSQDIRKENESSLQGSSQSEECVCADVSTLLESSERVLDETVGLRASQQPSSVDPEGAPGLKVNPSPISGVDGQTGTCQESNSNIGGWPAANSAFQLSFAELSALPNSLPVFFTDSQQAFVPDGSVEHSGARWSADHANAALEASQGFLLEGNDDMLSTVSDLEEAVWSSPGVDVDHANDLRSTEIDTLGAGDPSVCDSSSADLISTRSCGGDFSSAKNIDGDDDDCSHMHRSSRAPSNETNQKTSYDMTETSHSYLTRSPSGDLQREMSANELQASLHPLADGECDSVLVQHSSSDASLSDALVTNVEALVVVLAAYSRKATYSTEDDAFGKRISLTDPSLTGSGLLEGRAVEAGVGKGFVLSDAAHTVPTCQTSESASKSVGCVDIAAVDMEPDGEESGIVLAAEDVAVKCARLNMESSESNPLLFSNGQKNRSDEMILSVDDMAAADGAADIAHARSTRSWIDWDPYWEPLEDIGSKEHPSIKQDAAEIAALHSDILDDDPSLTSSGLLEGRVLEVGAGNEFVRSDAARTVPTCQTSESASNSVGCVDIAAAGMEPYGEETGNVLAAEDVAVKCARLNMESSESNPLFFSNGKKNRSDEMILSVDDMAAADAAADITHAGSTRSWIDWDPYWEPLEDIGSKEHPSINWDAAERAALYSDILDDDPSLTGSGLLEGQVVEVGVGKEFVRSDAARTVPMCQTSESASKSVGCVDIAAAGMEPYGEETGNVLAAEDVAVKCARLNMESSESNPLFFSDGQKNRSDEIILSVDDMAAADAAADIAHARSTRSWIDWDPYWEPLEDIGSEEHASINWDVAERAALHSDILDDDQKADHLEAAIEAGSGWHESVSRCMVEGPAVEGDVNALSDVPGLSIDRDHYVPDRDMAVVRPEDNLSFDEPEVKFHRGLENHGVFLRSGVDIKQEERGRANKERQVAGKTAGNGTRSSVEKASVGSERELSPQSQLLLSSEDCAKQKQEGVSPSLVDGFQFTGSVHLELSTPDTVARAVFHSTEMQGDDFPSFVDASNDGINLLQIHRQQREQYCGARNIDGAVATTADEGLESQAKTTSLTESKGSDIDGNRMINEAVGVISEEERGECLARTDTGAAARQLLGTDESPRARRTRRKKLNDSHSRNQDVERMDGTAQGASQQESMAVLSSKNEKEEKEGGSEIDDANEYKGPAVDHNRMTNETTGDLAAVVIVEEESGECLPSSGTGAAVIQHLKADESPRARRTGMKKSQDSESRNPDVDSMDWTAQGISQQECKAVLYSKNEKEEKEGGSEIDDVWKLDTSMKSLKCFTVKQRSKLMAAGFYTLRSLVEHYPRMYVQYRQGAQEIQDGEYLMVLGRVEKSMGRAFRGSLGVIEIVISLYGEDAAAMEDEMASSSTASRDPACDNEKSGRKGAKVGEGPTKPTRVHLKRFFRGRYAQRGFVMGMAAKYPAGTMVAVSGKVKMMDSGSNFEMKEFVIRIVNDPREEREHVGEKAEESDVAAAFVRSSPPKQSEEASEGDWNTELDWMEEGKLHKSSEIHQPTPIYSSKGSLSARIIGKLINRTLKLVPEDVDPIPKEVCKMYGLMNLYQAYQAIHRPASKEEVDSARQRLVFDEFFYQQLAKLLRRQLSDESILLAAGVSADDSEGFLAVSGSNSSHSSVPPSEWSLLAQRLLACLPFRLTKSQQLVTAEIIGDLHKPVPMSRLLQGDVGCGKTVVAFLALLEVISAGFQGAVMAPTEFLASQHFHQFKAWLALMDEDKVPRLELLTGSMAGRKGRIIRQGLQSGDISLVVGTHSLISEGTEFCNLGMAVIDEQHRFGVEQRARLNRKGRGPIRSNDVGSESDEAVLKGAREGGSGVLVGPSPHILAMSATPIPRSLALALHGDMSLSQIDERPPGRSAVKTYVLEDRPEERGKAYKIVRDEVKNGGRAFVVYPLIESSEFAQDLRAAVVEYERLQNDEFSGLKCGLVHGRLPASEKEETMKSFKEGDMDILFSTTVVEVGIDIPEATVMLVEHAERYGMAQLHQLRGRVGRGDRPSVCILLVSSSGSLRRLQTLENSQDGFYLAEMDLQHRGPGELLGKRQSGHLPEFALARWETDGPLMEMARSAAAHLLSTHPGLHDLPRLRQELHVRVPLVEARN